MASPRATPFALVAGLIMISACTEPATTGAIQVMVFSGAQGFRHVSIDTALSAFQQVERDGEIDFTFVDDPAELTLDNHDVLVWNNATGETPLTKQQKDALITQIRSGKGFVAIHGAADGNYEWTEMGRLVGTYFSEHPHASGPARLIVEDRNNPIVSALPDPWTVDEELYAWRQDPRARVHVLVSLDRSSITARASYARVHPLIWCQMVGEGRSFYTTLGHSDHTFRDPVFIEMLLQAIRWAAGRLEADCSTG